MSWKVNNMAHSIKNPQIKHGVKLDMDCVDRYICQTCCDVTPLKVVYQKKDITCKNCLKILGKKEICTFCGYIVDDWVVIEDKPHPQDWMMIIWRKIVDAGDIVCSECYVK
jgi:hypothetical protein